LSDFAFRVLLDLEDANVDVELAAVIAVVLEPDFEVAGLLGLTIDRGTMLIGCEMEAVRWTDLNSVSSILTLFRFRTPLML
jgi:hypothetical protein